MNPLGDDIRGLNIRLDSLNKEIKEFEDLVSNPEIFLITDVNTSWRRFLENLENLKSEDLEATPLIAEKLKDLSYRANIVANKVNQLINRIFPIRKIELLSKKFDDLVRGALLTEQKIGIISEIQRIKEEVASLLGRDQPFLTESGEIESEFCNSCTELITKIEETTEAISKKSVEACFDTLMRGFRSLNNLSASDIQSEISNRKKKAQAMNRLVREIPLGSPAIEQMKGNFNQLFKDFEDSVRFLETLDELSSNLVASCSLEEIKSIKMLAEKVYVEFREIHPSSILNLESCFSSFLDEVNRKHALTALFEDVESANSIQEIQDLKKRAEILSNQFQEVKAQMPLFWERILLKEEEQIGFLMSSFNSLISDLDDSRFSIIELKKRALEVLHEFRLSDSDQKSAQLVNRQYAYFLAKADGITELLKPKGRDRIQAFNVSLEKTDEEIDKISSKEDLNDLIKFFNVLTQMLKEEFRVLESIDEGKCFQELLQYEKQIREKVDLKFKAFEIQEVLGAETVEGRQEEVLKRFQRNLQKYEIDWIFSNSLQERADIREKAARYHEEVCKNTDSLDLEYKKEIAEKWLEFAVYTQKALELPPSSDETSQSLNEQIQIFVDARNRLFKEFCIADLRKKELLVEMRTLILGFSGLSQDLRYEKILNKLKRENNLIIDFMESGFS